MDRDAESFSGAVVRQEPVVAVTITCNLGQSRQMQLAAHFGRDEDAAVQNEVLDRISGLADRQKARYDLDDEEKNFRTVGLNLRNMIAGMGIAEKVLANQISEIKAKILGYQDAKKEAFNNGAEAWAGSGRKGAFQPNGHLNSQLKAIDAEIARAKQALEAAPKDAAQERGKLVNNIQRYQEDLGVRRAAIDGMRKIAGLEPNTEFLDEQNLEVKE